MKALSIQQPFAFEIMTGRKTIEVRSWDAAHRGDLLICASKKPAFDEEDMEDLEEEYGCAFLYGQALCVVRLVDVRNMRKGDEEGALVEKIDLESYSWIMEDVRLVMPFPVKQQKGLFDVDDSLIEFSPFRYGDSIAVRPGTTDQDFGVDFSGWCGRAADIVPLEEGESRIAIAWDSISLRSIPISVIEKCANEGIDWTGVLLRFDEVEPAEPRDEPDDAIDVIDAIVEENPDLFEELDEEE